MREKLRRARKCKDIWDISYNLSYCDGAVTVYCDVLSPILWSDGRAFIYVTYFHLLMESYAHWIRGTENG